MSRPEHTQAELEVLALYVLDLLDPAERWSIDEHLRTGCAQCESELADLRETLAFEFENSAPPVQPSPALRDRVLAVTRPTTPAPSPQLWKQWNAGGCENPYVIRSEEGGWEAIQPGISVKKLYVDPERDTVTMLIRMRPGTSYGRHLHAGAEQCFVLEGDLREGKTVVTAGDYQCLPAGSTHGMQTTENGCLLLIVSSLHDELLD